MGYWWHGVYGVRFCEAVTPSPCVVESRTMGKCGWNSGWVPQGEVFADNLLVGIHLIIEITSWGRLCGSLNAFFQVA